MKVGFIGLGVMGAPMAAHLQNGGHQLYLYDLAPSLPAALLQGGAIACDSGQAVTEQVDAVILMVPDTPDVEAALFGPHGKKYSWFLIQRRDIEGIEVLS
jgi:2-hydroxy-3-oxopropionate reductase